MFSIPPAPAWRCLTGWLVTGAVLDSQNRTIEASSSAPAPGPAVLRRVEQSWPSLWLSL
ncbi:MAG: hypothetical protein ACLS43_05075 [Evtepia gabavorous]